MIYRKRPRKNGTNFDKITKNTDVSTAEIFSHSHYFLISNVHNSHRATVRLCYSQQLIMRTSSTTQVVAPVAAHVAPVSQTGAVAATVNVQRLRGEAVVPSVLTTRTTPPSFTPSCSLVSWDIPSLSRRTCESYR